MNDTITLRKSTLVTLIGAVTSLYDDSTDPLDELGKPATFPKPGPTFRAPLLDFGPRPEPWRLELGLTVPWRSVVISRAVIEQVAALSRSEGSESGRSTLQAFVDDFCGTPPRWPWPWPWPYDRHWRFKGPNVLDLLLAGAQLHGAAELKTNRSVQELFSEAADQLLTTGLRNLESQGFESSLVAE